MEYEKFLRTKEYFADCDLTYRLDPLTGVLNRQVATEYIDYLAAHGKKFSLFLIDVDNFKNVNDSYGHPAGDEVLATVAQYFVDNAGEKGVVGRYGGDEFMIIFEDVTDYDEVWNYGHRIDINIGSVKFSFSAEFSVTVSIGIARCPIDGADYGTLLGVSDKALYRAKMKGRNCFIIYLPEKHANISLKKERDNRTTSMQMVYEMYRSLTVDGEDISMAIRNVFRSFVSNFMYDHMCVETAAGINFNVVHALSPRSEFKPVTYSLLLGSTNYAGNIRLGSFKGEGCGEDYARLSKEHKKHKLSSTFYTKISAYGKDYGFIRVDMVNSVRIWQNTEVSLVMALADMLGLILHYQKKTLEELPKVRETKVGAQK